MSAENPIAGDQQGQDWQSRGPWLVVLLLPLAALAFRRGWLLSMVLLVGVLSPPQSAEAAGWDDLWQRADQQATLALAKKDYQRASQVAENPLLRGSAEYRQGHYKKALEDFSQASGVTADYNRGNVLAQLGRYKDAISAYDNALKSSPKMEDAMANKAAVEALLKQQKQKKKDQQNKEGEKKEGDKKESGKDQQSKPGEQSGQDKQSKSGEQSEQNKQSKSGEPSEQDKQSRQGKQGEAPQKNHADKNTFANAAKALKEKQAEEAANEQQQASHAAEEKSAEKQPENSAQSSPPRQQAAEKNGQPTRAEALSSEEQMAAEQWLRRIPDDPGGLLRRKFQYQYQQRAQREGTGSAQPW